MLKADEIIMGNGLTLEKYLFAIKNRAELEKYLKPETFIITCRDISINVGDYESDAYVPIEFTTYRRLSNHDHDVVTIDTDTNMIELTSEFQYTFDLLLHLNAVTYPADLAYNVNTYFAIYDEFNRNLINTSAHRIPFPTYREGAAQYAIDQHVQLFNAFNATNDNVFPTSGSNKLKVIPKLYVNPKIRYAIQKITLMVNAYPMYND